VTLEDLQRDRDRIDRTALRCPAWDTLISADIGTPPPLLPMAVPPQRRATVWLVPRVTTWTPEEMTTVGRVRLAGYAPSTVTVCPGADEAACPFFKGLEHPDGIIRHSPVSFLAFTGGPHPATFGFGMHLFRLWFCWWLGLALPRTLAEDSRPEAERDLCRCGAIRDEQGYHRLTCMLGDLTGLARIRGHNHIAQVLQDLSFSAGLPSKWGGAVPPLPGTQQRGDISIEVHVNPGHGNQPTRGFIGDVALVSAHIGASAMSTDWGTLNPEALKKREDTKLKHYEFGYLQSLTAPWTFVPLVCSTLGHLQPRFLRLINFLAERQAARALQSDLRGESPARIRKLLRLRMQGRVACAVAVATAMRLGGFWADIHHPIRLPPRHIPDVPYTAECDLPLFPRGSEDAPVHQAYPLPRGGPAEDLFD